MTTLPISFFPSLLLIPAICFTICHANSNLLCIPSEREALLKFKNHLIDPSNSLSSWVEGGDCCKWIGVVCHNSTGHVHQLHLAALSSYDQSAINPSLLELKHLSFLDLSNNNFGSIPIPKFLGMLESLTYLNLSNAQFQGAIPHNLGNLSKLHYLDLGGNYLKPKSLQWVSGLSSLEYLDLSSADLHKANDWVQVWAAAVPGGGRELSKGGVWNLKVNPGTTGARIWGRTNCQFDRAGRGRCQTGDCGGLLQCNAYGVAPNTLAEFALNQFNNLDFFDISLVDGFNVPMEFSPTSGRCSRGIRCTADIIGQCPNELKAPGGCNNPCTVYKTDQYCCNSGNCVPTDFSRFFKARCPDAYSYPKDDQTSLFTCPGGTNYRVVFCP